MPTARVHLIFERPSGVVHRLSFRFSHGSCVSLLCTTRRHAVYHPRGDKFHLASSNNSREARKVSSFSPGHPRFIGFPPRREEPLRIVARVIPITGSPIYSEATSRRGRLFSPIPTIPGFAGTRTDPFGGKSEFQVAPLLFPAASIAAGQDARE